MLPSLVLAHAFGCRTPESPVAAQSNVIVLLTDDMGIDKTSVYDEHPSAATPHIDGLAATGVLFRNAYAQPSCSPSRAALLTGRQPTRHGLGRWIEADEEPYGLPDDELTIPELLRLAPERWTSKALGKWHLTGFENDAPTTAPLDHGFDEHKGTLANPLEAIDDSHYPRTYTNWEKSVDGSVSWMTRYLTVDTFDDAVATIGNIPEPFFLYVAPNAAHTPLHDPPADLLDAPLPNNPTEYEQHTAMIQVLDDQIGRFLDAIPPHVRERTTIIYASDNGTADEVDVIQEPWNPDRAKETLYEGGVRVPLIITGPLVDRPGSECNALVSLVDILPTVAEIAGVPFDSLVVPSGEYAGSPLVLDGYSLLPYLRNPDAPPQHPYVFAEAFFPNGVDESALDWRNRMLRTPDWKIVRNETPDGEGGMIESHRFFRMVDGALDEGEDLLRDGALEGEEQKAYDTLMAAMDDQVKTLTFGQAPR